MYKAFKEDIEKFKDNVASANSIKDLLEKYNLPIDGYYYSQVNKSCEELGIKIKKQHSSTSKKSLDEILTENSNFSRYHLKKRLLQENLLANECFNCKLGPEWNNKPLSLQLEHKNGINNDNRLENLALLCPNCHSQTETYAGKKNKKPDVLCSVCGKNGVSSGSKRHIYCKFTRDKKIDWPEIDNLIKMVEESSYSAVGRELGVSGNAVKFHIKRAL